MFRGPNADQTAESPAGQKAIWAAMRIDPGEPTRAGHRSRVESGPASGVRLGERHERSESPSLRGTGRGTALGRIVASRRPASEASLGCKVCQDTLASGDMMLSIDLHDPTSSEHRMELPRPMNAPALNLAESVA